MRWFLFTIFFASNVLANESAGFFLRARVPAIFKINISSKGDVTLHSNQAKSVTRPQIDRVTKNGREIITVTHP